MNYVKLMPGIRDGSGDQQNIPAYTESNTNYATPLALTPSLNARLASTQVREFRFRGVPYISEVFNANIGLGSVDGITGHTVQNTYNVDLVSASPKYFRVDGLHAVDFKVGDNFTLAGSATNTNGIYVVSAVASIASTTKTAIYVTDTLVAENPGTGTITTAAVNEFHGHFTSPGMVGADFFNVYSNAIFFSETGDGKTTSFTSRGDDWMDGATDTPTGIFYSPYDGVSAEPYYSFTVRDSDGVTRTPLQLGYANGITLQAESNILIAAGDTSPLDADTGAARITGNNGDQIFGVGVDRALPLTGGNDIYLGNTYAGGDIYLKTDITDGEIQLSSFNTAVSTYSTTPIAISLTAVNGGVTLSANDNVTLSAVNDVRVAHGTGVTDALRFTNATGRIYADERLQIRSNDDNAADSTHIIELAALASGGDFGARVLIEPTFPTVDSGRVQIIVDGNDTNSGTLATKGLVLPNMQDGASATNLRWHTASGQIIYSSSSRRVKTNIQDMRLEDTEWIWSLRLRMFEAKEPEREGQILYGLIAEETEEVNAHLVDYNHEGQPQAVQYQSVFSALLRVVQDQQKRIEALEAKA
jgi:hypothetical protein